MVQHSCLMLAISIINKYIQNETNPLDRQETDTLFTKATAYINENYTKKISINSLCKELLTNRQKLTKLFKNYTDFTLHEYIVSLRIARAKQLIADGEKPSKIYMQCGFDDYSSFYRAFKKTNQHTPKEFYKSITENASRSVSPKNNTEIPGLANNALPKLEPIENGHTMIEYFYINSYIKKHSEEYVNGYAYVSEILRNDLLNYPASMNRYAVPGYIPALNPSAGETACKGYKRICQLIAPRQNTFSLTLTGKAGEPSSVQIKINDAEVERCFWSVTEGSITTKQTFHLEKGASKLSLEVLQGLVEIEDIYIDLAPLSAKCNADILTSSAAAGSKTSYLYDGNPTTAWKSDPGDPMPWIEFRFTKPFYFDHFLICGNTSHIKRYEIQISSNTTAWTTVYRGNEIISGKRKYIHGTNEVRGKRFRIVFSEITEPAEIYEMRLSPYINWAREDTNAAVHSENDIGQDLTEILNGDRIHPGLITVNSQTLFLQFTKPRKIDTVTVVGIQESVKDGEEGEIPDSDMTSKYVQRAYSLSYLDQSGKWVQSASYITMPDCAEEEALRKVLNNFVLENPVITTAVQVDIGTSYWVRVIELEAIESYTIQ